MRRKAKFPAQRGAGWHWLVDFVVFHAFSPSPPPPPPPPPSPTLRETLAPRLSSPPSTPRRRRRRRSPLSPASSPPPQVYPFPISPSPSLRGFWTGIFLVFFFLAGDSSMVVVGSAESFASILSKVEADKLPAVFYYTAVWCGPCKAMAPVIAKLSSKYPKIPVYKVDIDMDGVGNKLSNLKIFSVPTFHFYHQGQKTSEVVGADVTKLEATMESLHKQL
ncbi:hypothetical protein ABZP36_020865 [Zizania latifolia]